LSTVLWWEKGCCVNAAWLVAQGPATRVIGQTRAWRSSSPWGRPANFHVGPGETDGQRRFRRTLNIGQNLELSSFY
jgi:hypothetical protein